MMAPMNTPIHIAFNVEVPELTAELPRLEELVREICKKYQVKAATIDIGIVDDDGIIKVHQEFLGKNNTTDVISFDLSDVLEQSRTFQLVVNAEMAARQAAKRGHSAEAELALYITHGMLHNLGFDDLDEEDAKNMHKTEDAVLQELGFGIIYYHNENTE